MIRENHTYIIGEIGQNHNGSTAIAKKIIDEVAKPVYDPLFNRNLPVMDAIKLTRRDLKEELSTSAWNRPYVNPNSFGKTYGEHRTFLELSDEEHYELFLYAKEKQLEVVETLCAKGCLTLLNHFQPDYLKVASRDLTNLPLLAAMAETSIPMILSTGMGGAREIDDALRIISRYHEKISILHCISQYPAEYENINLLSIQYLKEVYPQYTIGYSDHSIGIVVPSVAVALGAKIIEKHITLDRNMKGTDHRGSLGVDGIFRMVRDIRNVERALGTPGIFISQAVEETRKKLERSVATNKLVKKGQIIREEDIHLLSPGDGYKWSEKDAVVGCIALLDIPENEIIYKTMISEK